MSIAKVLGGAILRNALPVAQAALRDLTPSMNGREIGKQLLSGGLGALGDLASQGIARGLRRSARQGGASEAAATAISVFGPPFLNAMSADLLDRIQGAPRSAHPPYGFAPRLYA